MNRIWLTEQEAISWSEIQKNDMTDSVGLVLKIGHDPRSFFVGHRCEGLDFRGSAIEGVSFFGANLDGAFFYSDQLKLVISTGPLSWEGAIVEDRPDHPPSNDADANLSAETADLSVDSDAPETLEQVIEAALPPSDLPVDSDVPETLDQAIEDALPKAGRAKKVKGESPQGRAELAKIEIGLADRLGHGFARPNLLTQALTHPSVGSPSMPDNQRLAYIGNSMLRLLVGEALFAKDQQATMGQLTPRINALVRANICADVARKIDLGSALRLGASERKSGGKNKDAILSDAMEAVLGAIYFDGGLEASRDAILRLWAPHLDNVEEDARDPKTVLNERVTAQGLRPPKYTETAREGPAHAPLFTIEVRLEDGRSASAQGKNKKEAQSLAARKLLDLI